MTDEPMTATRAWAASQIRQAKAAQGFTWNDLADAIGRSVIWTTSALLGQQSLQSEQAAKIIELLGLGEDVKVALLLPAMRGAQAVDRTEPLVYRLHEIVQVYGQTISELVAENFGDGIMSAIDFELDFARVPDPKGDRVVLTLNGKFLPYRVW